MKFDSPYNPKETEEKIYKLWEKSGFFNPDNLKNAKKPFTIAIPPPNVTGSLHMGHALNAVIQDILIRFKRMAGFKTLWAPGTDHAGIATQSVMEKKLKKEGKTRFDLGREKFVEEIWKWKNEYGSKILGQLKRLGASCDWSRTRFTMDKDYSAAVFEAFIQYYNHGWIYRSERVVNWCPRCQTSLSDLELEHKDEKTHLWYIKYPIALRQAPFQGLRARQGLERQGDNNFIIVATTRPETMLGDTAVAVNPKDERYKKLVGQKVLLPLMNREIPIIADRLVDIDFGTGAVKVTPAHSLVDWQIGQTHNLPMISVIDERDRMNANATEAYRNMKIEEARKKIVEDLSALNLVEKIEDYIHSVPKCYRCDSTVELIPSKQWFVKMDELAKMAMTPVKNGKIKFHPKRWEKVYLDWLKNSRDWCISRQIWWGHRLPIWFCQNQIGISNSQFLISKKIKNSKLKIENSSAEQFVISIKKPTKCPFCGNCKMEQSADVLDTWFSSALWPFAILGWPASAKASAGKPQKTSDLERFYPTDVLSTARDIINLWVARMAYSGIALTGKIPFKDVIIHATVITKEGQRMSKSLGTGTDPLEMVEKYGADATRFGLAWQISEAQDMRFGEEDILAGKKFCNKIWNASRFVLQNINLNIQNTKYKIQNTNLTPADKKILNGLEKLKKETKKYIEKYEFGKALHRLYDFFWHQYADIYIETAKKQLADDKSKANTQNVLLNVHSDLLRMLHPFLPFITEEIWQTFGKLNKSKKLILVENWPK